MRHMQKSREALADARRSIWKRIKNKQWTYCSSFIWKTWFYSLVPFFCFLIRSFNSFCSYFYYCNWPESFHHHAYSRHQANKEWLIFPTTTPFLGTTLIKNGSSFPSPRLFRATRLFGREEYIKAKAIGNVQWWVNKESDMPQSIEKKMLWATFIFTFYFLQPRTRDQIEYTNVSHGNAQFLAWRNLRLTRDFYIYMVIYKPF